MHCNGQIVDNQANSSGISMLIKKSKTDQGQRGAKIYLGNTGDSLYPIAAMDAYLSVRGSSSVGVTSNGSHTSLCQSQTLLNM